MDRGIAVSPGVVVAPAYCLAEFSPSINGGEISPADLSRELHRFESACSNAETELCGLMEKVSFEIGDREAEIFRAHLTMLRDRAFLTNVRTRIVNSRREAALALVEALAEYEALFAEIQNEYLRDRIVDLRDVARRIHTHLEGSTPVPQNLDFDTPFVLVTRELFPSQTVGFGSLKLAGIVTEQGGGTSHAAVIARSMGIPAVTGIRGILERIKTGEILAVDGREGCVLVNPGPEAEAAFRKLQREFFDFRNYLIENRDQSACTIDGHSIELLANINNCSDAEAAGEVGAEGIGLFRTEYLFMTHATIPDEQEQYETYCKIRDHSPGRQITIRTLDLGGDKTVPYLGSQRESNPFMGWRSIRLSFDHPEFFLHQIRAILRAGTEGEVRILFPMISTIEELRRVNRMVWRAKRQLAAEGIPFAEKLPQGIMIEVPSAALCIEDLIEHLDFVSVGTNDLVQYVMAADRDNDKVSELCDPLGPAIMRLLKRIADACNRMHVPVTVCGEMAGRPRCVLAMLAFGFRSFSMSPAFVPLIKELIHSVNLAETEALADEILRRRSARHIRRFLNRQLERINPKLTVLDFQN